MDPLYPDQKRGNHLDINFESYLYFEEYDVYLVNGKKMHKVRQNKTTIRI